jgi:hypothetical protein
VLLFHCPLQAEPAHNYSLHRINPIPFPDKIPAILLPLHIVFADKSYMPDYYLQMDSPIPIPSSSGNRLLPDSSLFLSHMPSQFEN